MTDGRENNGKNNGRNKPMICLDTARKFNSVIEAAEHFDICPSGISGVCHGRKKTTGDLRFAFADDNIDLKNLSEYKNDRKPRRIICIDTGELFETIIAASRKLGINRTNISDVCKGIRGTAGGLKFIFADVSPEIRNVCVGKIKFTHGLKFAFTDTL